MIKTVENAYQSLADEVIAFIEGREWESAGAHYRILSSSVFSEWWLILHGAKIKVGNAPPFNISKKIRGSTFPPREPPYYNRRTYMESNVHVISKW